jgi:hypothetical protein
LCSPSISKKVGVKTQGLDIMIGAETESLQDAKQCSLIQIILIRINK